jgi:hypothetical protein
MLTAVLVHAGADFAYHENYNALLEVEWMGGGSEMTEEEYAEGRFCRHQLRPARGGRYFQARLLGVGYVHGESRLY